MPSIQATSGALIFLIAMANGSSLSMKEGGAAGGCTGASGCCIPTCNVQVTDSLGASGVVRWSGNCQMNENNPSGTQDVDDDHQMTWLRSENGQVVIDVYRKSDKKYDRWAVDDCKSPDSTGGKQCAPSGGGCKTTQILWGAQGQVQKFP